jgi:hypothetical protein
MRKDHAVVTGVPASPIMDIGGWLRSRGLEEYEAAFRENKVDAAVLPNLTAEDLKDLGIAAVGDRRKLLEAIVALRNDEIGKAALCRVRSEVYGRWGPGVLWVSPGL